MGSAPRDRLRDLPHASMRRRALAALVAMLSAIPILPTGQVLCVGEGGHCQVETAGSDCCDGDDERPAERADVAPAKVPSACARGLCGRCVDIPLLRAPESGAAPRSHDTVPSAPECTSTDLVPRAFDLPFGPAAPRFDSRLRRRVDPLATIALLI